MSAGWLVIGLIAVFLVAVNILMYFITDTRTIQKRFWIKVRVYSHRLHLYALKREKALRTHQETVTLENNRYARRNKQQRWSKGWNGNDDSDDTWW